MPLTIEQKKQMNGFLPRLRVLEKNFITELNSSLLKTIEQDPRAASLLRLVTDMDEGLSKINSDFLGFVASVDSDNQRYIAMTIQEFRLVFTKIASLHRFCFELIGSVEVSFANAHLFGEMEEMAKGKMKAMPKFLKDYAKDVDRDVAPSLSIMQRSLAQAATVRVFQARLVNLRFEQRQDFLHRELKHIIIRMILSGAKIKPSEDLTVHYNVLNRPLPEKIDAERATEVLSSLRAVERVDYGGKSVLGGITLDGMVVVLTTQRLLDECAAHLAVLTSGAHETTSTWAESSITRARESLKQAQIWSGPTISGGASLPEVFYDGKRISFTEMLRDLLKAAADKLAAAIEAKAASVVAVEAKEKSEVVIEVVGGTALPVDGVSEKPSVPQVVEIAPETKPIVSVDSASAPMHSEVPIEEVITSSAVLEPQPVSAPVLTGPLESDVVLTMSPGSAAESHKVPPPTGAAMVTQISKEVPVVESSVAKSEEPLPVPVSVAESTVEVASAIVESKEVEIRRRVRGSVAENPALAAMAAMFRDKVKEDSSAVVSAAPKKDQAVKEDRAEIAPPVVQKEEKKEVKGSADDFKARVVEVSAAETQAAITTLTRFRERFTACKTADQVCGMFSEWDNLFQKQRYAESDAQDLKAVHLLLWARYYVLRLQELMPLTSLDTEEVTSAYFFFYDERGNRIRDFKDASVYALFDEWYYKIREYFDLETGARKVPIPEEPAAEARSAIEKEVAAQLVDSVISQVVEKIVKAAVEERPPVVSAVSLPEKDVPQSEMGTPPVVAASVKVAPNSAFLAPPKPLAVEYPKTPQDAMRARIASIVPDKALRVKLDSFIDKTFTRWVQDGCVPARGTLDSIRLVLTSERYGVTGEQADAIIAAAKEILETPKDTPKPQC